MAKTQNILDFLAGREVLSYQDIVKLREEGSENNLIAQMGGQENALASDADIVICGGNRGGGKGEPYSAPIITPYGIRRMGDLQIGDTITDVDGGRQQVIAIHELGLRKVYRLHFSDGTYVDCTDDHIWKLKKTHTVTARRRANNLGQDADWQLWSMKMIMDYLDRQNSGELKSKQPCRLLVPLCAPVKFSKPTSGVYKPKTDAYVIGALIGDGCMTEKTARGNLAATFANPDAEIVAEFIKAGLDMSHLRKKSDKSRCDEYLLYNNQLKKDLTWCKLAGRHSATKFIPEYYKYAPLEVRWALIQGLMDTDGTTDSRGHCSYTTVSPMLADDVAFILRSLGAYVSISKGKSGYKHNGEYIQCADYYNLYIKIKDSSRLFRLPRKKNRCKPYNGGVSEPTKRIVRYEYIGLDKCRCIKVSHPSALYLTNDFTVTHNTMLLLMGMLNDVYNPYFNAIILRNERDDLTDIINKSYDVFSEVGEYKKSRDVMCWDFTAGGSLTFSFHAGTYEDFKIRFQGREYSKIGIDEITHTTYPKFKYIATCNRNSRGIKNQIIGTCNPDPESWVATYIDWWIGEDGLPIKERDGVLRYCFMNGEDVGDIIWGDTPLEVYEHAKAIIDPLLSDGEDWNDYILSVTFIRAELDDNVALMVSDPKYKARLAGQSEEQRQRDLMGNWKFKSAGDDLIKWSHMDAFYNNSFQYGDGVRRVSCDVAFDGGDNLVMWLWIGKHIQDLFTCRADSLQTIKLIKSKLADWGVREENFTYDLQGVGQSLKGFFPNSPAFNNQESVADDVKHIYANLKSQAAYQLAQDIINCNLSINPDLIDRRPFGSKSTLREILNVERKIIRRDDANINKGWALIKKGQMKSLIGHSPDYFEGLIYFEKFFITPPKKPHTKPKLMRYVNPLKYR